MMPQSGRVGNLFSVNGAQQVKHLPANLFDLPNLI
jgi:hypothetical protein